MDWITLTDHFNCTKEDKQTAFETVKELVRWTELARTDGLLALEDAAQTVENVFLKHGLFFISNGATQEEWENYATAWILADQAKGGRLLEMAIITEGLSLILDQQRPQNVLFRLGAWLGSDLAAEVDRALRTMEACQYRNELAQRLQTPISALPAFDKLLASAPETLSAVIPTMDRRTLAIALKGASGKTYQTIMQGIPTDEHDALTEEINQMTNIRLCDVTKAQQAILNVLKEDMSSLASQHVL